LAQKLETDFFRQDINLAQVSLVFSPTPDCPCQNYWYLKTPIPCKIYQLLTKFSHSQNEILNCGDGGFACTGPSCFNLSNLPSAQSFRFIGGDCDQNNC
jgi:hypothetical protein